MKIIPVLDIKNGLVVHAISGRREEYQPVAESRLISSPIIERALYEIYGEGFREIYIADIDLIEEKTCYNFLKLYNHILSMFDKVYIDIGRRGLEYYNRDIIPSNMVIVIGTEYVDRDEIHLLNGKTMSLDMYGESVKLRDCKVDYRDLIYTMYRLSIIPERVLIIDLERVGTFTGIDSIKIEEISRKLRDIGVREILYGGGVRDLDDLKSLSDLVDSVIVGSALHKGSIR